MVQINTLGLHCEGPTSKKFDSFNVFNTSGRKSIENIKKSIEYKGNSMEIDTRSIKSQRKSIENERS